jgi:hypothetical protein
MCALVLVKAGGRDFIGQVLSRVTDNSLHQPTYVEQTWKRDFTLILVRTDYSRTPSSDPPPNGIGVDEPWKMDYVPLTGILPSCIQEVFIGDEDPLKSHPTGSSFLFYSFICSNTCMCCQWRILEQGISNLWSITERVFGDGTWWNIFTITNEIWGS